MEQFKNKAVKLDKLEAARILENIFEECEEEPNSIPMEELESYSNYKKETFLFQRIVLIVALILLILLPFLFVMPNYTVSHEEAGERGLPVYCIEISTRLPVRSVTAVSGNLRLPVYMVNAHSYTIEPTTNGKVEVTVTLFNGQYRTETITVESGDLSCPTYLGHDYDEKGNITLHLSDEGSGIDFSAITATAEDGSVITPAAYDSETGAVYFESDLKGYLVVIPDHYGNTLKINI